MSSLAASKSDNFYYPPGWRPEMGSISKFQGSSGSNQYEKYGIIRFELPFDGWCLGCGRHMSKGLRFNAKKEKAGKYFTTTIYSFHMKCYSCDQKFEIKTDPQNRTYEFASGLRKHEQDYEANVDEGIVEVGNDEVRQQINRDPMFKLQHQQEDFRNTQSARERLEVLQEIQDEIHKDDYDINAHLRKKNRQKRKREEEELSDGKRRGLNVRVVATTPSEEAVAKQVVYRRDISKLQSQDAYKRALIKTQSIFSRSDAYVKPHQIASGENIRHLPQGSIKTTKSIRPEILRKIAEGEISLPKK